MRQLLFTLLSLCGFNEVYASKITVSVDIGFDSSNSTEFLQEAFNTVTDTIVIDNVGMPWVTGPLELTNNDVTIIIERGVILNAVEGAYEIYDSMFRIWDKENITIRGYGAKIVMNKDEYIALNDSEFRHGMNIGSSANITIEGLTITDTGGDGILLSKSFYSNSTKNYCEDITIKNCVFDNNYRQGLSIVSIENAQILNSRFSNTNGTLPEAGIDIEPDDPSEIIENLEIRGCSFINNNGNGLQLTTFFMDDASQDISVTIEDCYFSSNHDPSNEYSYAEIAFYDNESNGTDGLVEVKNCYIENSDWTAVNFKKTVASYDIFFEDVMFKNVSNDPIIYNSPIFFEVTNYDNTVPRFGGVTFENCTISYSADIPFLDVLENNSTSDGLGNVQGNFFIISPEDQGFTIGTNPENVNISYEYLSTAPETIVGISAMVFDYYEDEINLISYMITRDTDHLIPLAINTDFTGETIPGEDYDLSPDFIMFKTDSEQSTAFHNIIDDDIEEGTETVFIELVENTSYDLSANSTIALTISDTNTLHIEDAMITDSIILYPNPVSSFVSIFNSNKLEISELNLYTIGGKLIKKFDQPFFELDLSFLPSGIYLADIISAKSKASYKIVKN